MKKSKSGRTTLTLIAATSLLVAGQMSGQTVLSGDHVIEGDLSVGTTMDKGNLKITGETGNTAAPGIKVTGDGGVVFEGTLGQGPAPALNAGTRFMWYSKKAALRVGRGELDQWNDLNIGIDSVAFGLDSYALAEGSLAFNRSYAAGKNSSAIGGAMTVSEYSTAISGGSAEGKYSVAISGGVTMGDFSTGASHGEAVGKYSTALSGGYATGEYATAMSGGYATARNAVSIGEGYAGGINSTTISGGYALGGGSSGISQGEAFGILSTAISRGVANANLSVAIGDGTFAASYRSVVVGSYNSNNYGNSQNWREEDPVFVVGNGTGNPSDPNEARYRDAFVVRKNGNFEMNGKITMPRQGDILMGEFGESEP